jgi:hypothetical protein
MRDLCSVGIAECTRGAGNVRQVFRLNVLGVPMPTSGDASLHYRLTRLASVAVEVRESEVKLPELVDVVVGDEVGKC